MKAYQILKNLYLGPATIETEASEGIPLGFTRTPIPDHIPEGHFVMWSGSGWALTTTPPPEVVQDSTPPPPVLISVGAFFDRFGSEKYNILASSDPLVKALVLDVSVRKFIDLNNPEINSGLDLITNAGFNIDKAIILSPLVSQQDRKSVV